MTQEHQKSASVLATEARMGLHVVLRYPDGAGSVRAFGPFKTRDDAERWADYRRTTCDGGTYAYNEVRLEAPEAL